MFFSFSLPPRHVCSRYSGQQRLDAGIPFLPSADLLCFLAFRRLRFGRQKGKWDWAESTWRRRNGESISCQKGDHSILASLSVSRPHLVHLIRSSDEPSIPTDLSLSPFLQHEETELFILCIWAMYSHLSTWVLKNNWLLLVNDWQFEHIYTMA